MPPSHNIHFNDSNSAPHRTKRMSRRLGQLFLDHPVHTHRATLSSIVSTHKDGLNGEHDAQPQDMIIVHNAADAATPALHPPSSSPSPSSSTDTDDDDIYDPQVARKLKMDKLTRTLGKNVPAELVFGTHLSVSMFHDPPAASLALSRTSSSPLATTTTTATATKTAPIATTTTSSTPTTMPLRAQTSQPWVAPWEEIDPESYAQSRAQSRAQGRSPSPTNGHHQNTPSRSFWRKAGEVATAGVGGAIGVKDDGGSTHGSTSGSSGLGRRMSDDSAPHAPGSGRGLSLSVVRIDPPPDPNSHAAPAKGLPSGSGQGSGLSIGAVAGKGGMSSLSMIARGAASDVNRRHGNLSVVAKAVAASAGRARLNCRRAARMTNIFGLPEPAPDANGDPGSSPDKTGMGKLDGKSAAGLAYMLDYERDTLYDLLSRTGDDIEPKGDPEWPYEDATRRTGSEKGKKREHSPYNENPNNKLGELARATARQKQMSPPVPESTLSTSSSPSPSPSWLAPHPSRASSLPPSHTPHHHHRHRPRTPSPHPPVFNKLLPLPPAHDPDLHHYSARRPYPPTIKRTYTHDHDEGYPYDLQPSPKRTDTHAHAQVTTKPSQELTSPKRSPTDLTTLHRRRTARLEKFFHVSYRDLFESMVAFSGVEDDGDDGDEVMDEAKLRKVLGEKSWERICGEKERMDRGREGTVLVQKPSSAAAREGTGAGVSMMAVAEMVAGSRTQMGGAGVTGLATPWPLPPRLDSMKGAGTGGRPKTATATAEDSRASTVARHRRSTSLSLLSPPPVFGSASSPAREEFNDVPTMPIRVHNKSHSTAATSQLSTAHGDAHDGRAPLTVVSTTNTTSSTSTSPSSSSSSSSPTPASAPTSASSSTSASSFGHHLKPHPNPLLLPPQHGYVGGRDTPVPPSPPPFARFWPPSPLELEQQQQQQQLQQQQAQQQLQMQTQQREAPTTTTAVHVHRKGVIKRVVSVSRGARGGARAGDKDAMEWRKKGEDMQGVMNRLRELR